MWGFIAKAAPSLIGSFAVNKMFDGVGEKRHEEQQAQIDQNTQGVQQSQMMGAQSAAPIMTQQPQVVPQGQVQAMPASAPQGQMAQPAAQPAGGGGLSTGGAVGLAGAGLAAGGAASMIGGKGKDGDDKGFEEDAGSFGQTMLAGGGGAVAGAVSKWKESDSSGVGKLFDAAKGAFLGGGAGALTKMSHDAVQEEGGGMKAGLTSAGANALTSMLKDDGPGFFKSGAAGFASGFGANMAHDKLTEMGHDGIADTAGGAGLGAGLGYSYDGGKTALLGAGGGGALGGLGSMLSGGKGDGDSLGISSQGAEAGGVMDMANNFLGGDDKQSDGKDNDFQLG